VEGRASDAHAQDPDAAPVHVDAVVASRVDDDPQPLNRDVVRRRPSWRAPADEEACARGDWVTVRRAQPNRPGTNHGQAGTVRGDRRVAMADPDATRPVAASAREPRQED